MNFIVLFIIIFGTLSFRTVFAKVAQFYPSLYPMQSYVHTECDTAHRCRCNVPQYATRPNSKWACLSCKRSNKFAYDVRNESYKLND